MRRAFVLARKMSYVKIKFTKYIIIIYQDTPQS